jgi:integrase
LLGADLGIKAQAHMLRHACGYRLANDGHDAWAIQAYLGHCDIQNTTRHKAGVAAVQGILSRARNCLDTEKVTAQSRAR